MELNGLTVALAAAGLGLGALVCWLWMRGAVVAAQAGARAELEGQLSTAAERARGLEAERAHLQGEHEALRRQAGAWRDQLDTATNELARLEERASRVPDLEQQVREGLLKAQEVMRLGTELRNRSEALQHAESELALAKRDRDEARQQAVRAQGEHRELSGRLDVEREAQEGRLRDLQKSHDAMSNQFKVIAEQILEEKSAKFTEQNRQNLGQLLEPLKTQINEFKGKVEQVYEQEGKDRSALAEQVRSLITLNQTLSKEAHNLTNALKNESKTQGNWGELILQRVLEAAGLAKGIAYHPQDSQVTEDGRRLQPDVVIKLPGDRNLVVDSKVSLVAYEEHASAQDDESRERALKRHMDSVRGHIKGLSGKEYQKLYGLKSIDFVLMFVPIEPAFMTAVTADSELFMDAWDKNVLLVSPSTLLFVVRTVAHLWRQEDQSRNAMAIAKRGAELYDRLVDFVKDLDNVGDALQDANKSYASAHKRLTTGRGNVIRQAEMLRDLGVKPSKALPGALLEMADGEEHARPVAALAVEKIVTQEQLAAGRADA